jgi:hypothetical protein
MPLTASQIIVPHQRHVHFGSLCASRFSHDGLLGGVMCSCCNPYFCSDRSISDFSSRKRVSSSVVVIAAAERMHQSSSSSNNSSMSHSNGSSSNNMSCTSDSSSGWHCPEDTLTLVFMIIIYPAVL